MKGINAIRKLSNVLSTHCLVTIYKSFINPHLDYGDTVYDQHNNDKFCQIIGSMQFNVAHAITGATKGMSQANYIKN